MFDKNTYRKIYPFEVYRGKGTGNLPKNSKVKADQVRTLDKSRLVKLIGELETAEIAAIEKALKIHLNFKVLNDIWWAMPTLRYRISTRLG